MFVKLVEVVFEVLSHVRNRLIQRKVYFCQQSQIFFLILVKNGHFILID